MQPAGSTTLMVESITWSGMAIPLIACAAIWGIGGSAPRIAAWFSVLHGIVTAAASGWTVLRFLLARRVGRVRNGRRAPRFPPASLVVLYGLLLLQPSLAVSASMLHGDPTSVFGIPLPSVMPANPDVARRIDQLHVYNAFALLAMISMHVVATWSRLQRAKVRPIARPS